MTARAETIRSFRQNGQSPDRARAARTETLNALMALSEALHADAILTMEAETEQQVAEARRMSAELRRQGMDFDMDRIMRPSLSDRVVGPMEEARDWMRGKVRPCPAQLPEDLPFAVSIPVRSTRPGDWIALGYDALYERTGQFRGAVAEQISGVGGAPIRLVLPEVALDDLFEAEKGDGDTDIFCDLSSVKEYWPASDGRPALGLFERQRDGGLPIEILMIARGAAAHHRITMLSQDHGGRWA